MRATARVCLGLLTAIFTAQTAQVAAQSDYQQSEDPWYRDGAAALNQRLAQQPNTNRAKNVILFVADGMGISTITAARILEG